jgi:glucose/arabinose dehydrogenase
LISMKKIWIYLSVIVLFTSCSDNQESEDQDRPQPLIPVDTVLDTLLEGLNRPWGFEFLPNGNILIAERSGSLLLYDGETTKNITSLPAISAVGQGGLMDLCLHPDYMANGWLYFSASAPGSGGFSTALFRAKLQGEQLTQVEKLFQADPVSNSSVHFGSRIVFDQSGYVYLSFGDRGTPSTAQDLTNHNGTVIRLNDDGSVPTDNPFIDSAGAQKEIWTYGHRNVQGMAVNPENGGIWTHEHGPRGGDEINLLERGANYAWPLATYGINYNGTVITEDTFAEGTIAPKYYWVPSIAPCGMAFYYSDSIPQWKGNIFLGALAGTHLNRLELSGEKVVKEDRLLNGMARFRAVKQGPDGYLYFSTEGPGMLCRFRPKS